MLLVTAVAAVVGAVALVRLVYTPSVTGKKQVIDYWSVVEFWNLYMLEKSSR